MMFVYENFIQPVFIMTCVVVLYHVYDMISRQQDTIDKLQLEITKLNHITQKNKKEIIAIRNDMEDYLNFQRYNYDDDD